MCNKMHSLQILVKTSHVMMDMSVWCMSLQLRPTAIPTVTSTPVMIQRSAWSRKSSVLKTPVLEYCHVLVGGVHVNM